MKNHSPRTWYEFDSFVVDVVNRVLLKDGAEIPITAKVFDVLLIFLQNPGRLLTKEELISSVWHREFVEEQNLARNVSSLRKALGDMQKEHKYIATVQGQGYKFISDIQARLPEAAVKHIRRPAKRWPFIVAGGLAIIVIIWLSWSWRRGSAEVKISSIQEIRLTTGGKASRAIISPDGTTVIYTENEELKSRNLVDGNVKSLASAVPEFSYVGLSVPPSGGYVYFTARRPKSVLTLYRIPLVGGERETVLEGVYGGISFSPDGSRFAFVRRYPDINEYVLFTASSDGTDIEKVVTTSRPDNIDGTPSWSPDGRIIVCPRIVTADGFHFEIMSVDVATGTSQTIASRRWAWLNSLVWLSDSQQLLLVGQDESEVNAQVWQLDLKSGEALRLRDDSFIYESLSGSSLGDKFVAVKKRLESHVWIINDDIRQITTGFEKYDGVAGLAFGPASQLFYHSRASGRDAIWRTDQEGNGSEIITPDGGAGFDVSPDGRFIVFQKREPSGLGLSRLDLLSGGLLRLTDKSADMTPHFSPGGDQIIYCRFSDRHSINTISSDGGEPAMLFDKYRTVSSPSISPDGSKIAFAFGRTEGSTIRSGIGILSVTENEIVASFDTNFAFGTIYERPTIQWSADGRYLNYIKLEGGVSNIWKIDIYSNSSQPVTNFNTGRVFNFDFSADGSRIALARGSVESDVLILQR